MKVIYQASTYTPELVTGLYVRCHGRKGAYLFRVIEAASGQAHPFKGKPGHGNTLREYDCDGSGLPVELRDRCIASKRTELWKYQ
jgi:hypothetical protein